MGRKRKCKADVEDNDFSKKSWMEDLALLVEGKQLYVSKTVLALESPVFRTMFEAEFKEKNKDEIELKEKNHEDFLQFLQCLYPGVRKPITIANVFTVLPLAEEYQVNTVKNECEKFLLEETNNPLKPTAFYCRAQRISSLFNLPVLEEACIEQLSKKTMKQIEISEKCHPLPTDSKNKLLTKINENQEEKIKEIEQDCKSKILAKDTELAENELIIDDLREKEARLENFITFFNEENDHRIQGLITLDITNANGLSTNGVEAGKMFRGVKWGLMVSKSVEEGKEYLSVSAKFGTGSPVECKARITFTVKSTKSDVIRKIDNRTFSYKQSCWGFPTLLIWEEFISQRGGYVHNNRAKVEMSLLVHHPVSTS